LKVCVCKDGSRLSRHGGCRSKPWWLITPILLKIFGVWLLLLLPPTTTSQDAYLLLPLGAWGGCMVANLAGNAGNMSATCRRRVEMSPIFSQNARQCRHQNSPNTEFCVGFLATLYHIPRSYICTNTHTKNLCMHKDPLPLPKKMTQLLFIRFCNSTMAHSR
jgi:hypothetical protein